MSTLAVTFIVLYSMAIIVVLESSGMFLPKRVSFKTLLKLCFNPELFQMSPYINTREKVLMETEPKKRPFCNAFTGKPTLEKHSLAGKIVVFLRLW